MKVIDLIHITSYYRFKNAFAGTFFTLLISGILPQFFTARIDAQITEFKLDNYTIEEGLSNDYVTCIAQDSVGFIWIATHRGLDRFDGHSFRSFENVPDDPNSLISSHVETIYFDSENNLWIGTLKGLDKLNTRTEKIEHISENSANIFFRESHIKTLLDDHTGYIWIGTYGKGLFRIDKRTNEVVEQFTSESGSKLSSNYVNCLYQDEPGIIWIGTQEGGLNKLNVETKKIQIYNSVENQTVNIGITIISITRDAKNNLLLTTWLNGICKFDKQKGIIENYEFLPKGNNSLENTPITSIKTDEDGIYWITTFNNGLVVYDPKTKSVLNFKNETEEPYFIKTNITWCLFEDKYGVIWVGTFGIGVLKMVKYNPNIINISNEPPKNKKHSLNSTYVTAIFEDDEHNIWVGTGSGLNLYNRQNNTFDHFYQKSGAGALSSDNFIHSIYEDKLKRLWIGVNGGIEIYDLQNKKFSYLNPSDLLKSKNKEPRDVNIYNVCMDSYGFIWIGSYDNGVYKYNPITGDCKIYKYDATNKNSVSNDVAWCIYEDSHKTIWIGTRNGLNRYDRKNDNFIQYLPKPSNKNSISNEVIADIYEDTKKHLWIATLGGGLNEYRYQTDDFISIKSDSVLIDNNVAGIVEDKRGNLWLSTIKGITKYNPSTRKFKSYDRNCGLSGNSYNLGACLSSSDGRLYFGGNNGINIFHPDSMHEFTRVPEVVLTDFKCFNKSVKSGEKYKGRVILPVSFNNLETLKLKYSDNVISFEFAILDYAFPKSNRYKYKLQGFDKEWIETDASRRFASYTNLKPGRYVFSVIATNHNGSWNYKGKNLRIIISPPYWKTAWFIITLIIIALLGIYLYTWSRIRHFRVQKLIFEDLVRKKTAEIANKNTILEKANQELNHQKEEILLQKNEIQEMNELIKEADSKKLNFFTNISHEFRTPLTLILGPVENLIEKVSNNTGLKQQLLIIQKNANRLLRLINEILDFHKIDSDNLKVQLTQGDVVKFIFEIVHAFDELAARHKKELIFNSGVIEFTTYFDPAKIEIIMYNLISNAFKYTHAGGTINIFLTIPDNKEHIKIIVQDNGIGIEKSKINQIFNRYYQIEAANNQNQGSGIGLALTKELIHLLNGQINVISKVNEGTTFIIYLPTQFNPNFIPEERITFVPLDEPTINNQLLSQFIQYETAFQKNPSKNDQLTTRILVVDDNDDLRNYIHDCLSELYLIYEANDGQRGIEMAKSILPHLIISDIMMPVIDGIEFCRIIKSDIYTSHVPVILLTAKTGHDVQMESYAIGADDYITKPFQKDLLIARIQNLITSRQRLREIFKTKFHVEPAEITVTSTDERFLQKALGIVEKHIDDPDFGSSELVAELGMSRTIVHLKLKKLTDTSAGEFIKNIRLKRACQLLRQNDHRVSEICYMVGFADPKYFSKVFKNSFGISPVQFAEKES